MLSNVPLFLQKKAIKFVIKLLFPDPLGATTKLLNGVSNGVKDSLDYLLFDNISSHLAFDNNSP